MHWPPLARERMAAAWHRHSPARRGAAREEQHERRWSGGRPSSPQQKNSRRDLSNKCSDTHIYPAPASSSPAHDAHSICAAISAMASAERLLAASVPPEDAPAEAAEEGAPPPLTGRTWWRAAHAGGFLLGGLTFILGTAALYPVCAFDACPGASAALYVVGSLGFLSVDLLETAAYVRAPCALRLNIGCSAAGSALYVAGSTGFLPAVAASSASALGLAGFLAGSALIAASQTWKVARLLRGLAGSGGGGSRADAATAICVEAGAGLGALLFLVGSALDAPAAAAVAGPGVVLALWMAGSVSFSIGAAFLLARHYALDLA